MNGQEYVLAGEAISIGRAPDNAIVVDEESVSGHHAEIRSNDGMIIIRDLGSSNGTVLNGIRVIEAPLNEDSTIQFGSVVASIAFGASSATEATESGDPSLERVLQALADIRAQSPLRKAHFSLWPKGRFSSFTFALSLAFAFVLNAPTMGGFVCTMFLGAVLLVITVLRYGWYRFTQPEESVQQAAPTSFWRRPQVPKEVELILLDLFLL